MTNKNLIVENRFGNYAEILTDFDYGSFKYTWSKNEERQLEFTAYRTNRNYDVFDMLVNEAYLKFEGQYFVIKSTALKHDNQIVSCEVTAKHIFMETQNWYVNKDITDESLNSEVGAEEEDDNSNSEDTEEEQTGNLYTLKQYLDFGFKDNPLGYTYEIIGDFPNRGAVDELGNKNLLEYITAGAEIFGYIYFADNKHIKFYTEDEFYQQSDVVLYYKANTEDTSAIITTTDLKTFARGYGRKKTKTETKNYNPIKPKNLKLSGTYSKEGNWWTATVGGYYEKTFDCKWGNEVLIWANKQASLGGKVDIYLDGEKIGSFKQYKKTVKTDQIVVARNLEKGKHTFRAVFRGGESGVDYRGKSPRMYIGTERTTILNLTAVPKGKDLYHTYAEYKSPNYEAFGHMEAATIFSKDITSKKDLEKLLQESIIDTPTVELSTSYIGYDEINENNTMRFVHKFLKFNDDLKVIKIVKSHPYTNTPSEIEFSNAKDDMVSIQKRMVQRINNANSSIAYGGLDVDTIGYQGYSDVMGSVFIDE